MKIRFPQLDLLRAMLVALCILLPSIATAAPPQNTGKGIGVYRGPVDANGNPTDPYAPDCAAEKQSIMDQGKALGELDGDYQDKPQLLKVTAGEFERLKQQWDALKSRCPGVTGDFPFRWTGKPDDPMPPMNGKPDPNEAIDSDPLGNIIVSATADAGVGAITGGGAALFDGLFGDNEISTLGQVIQHVIDEATEEAVKEGAKGAAIDTGTDILTEVLSGGEGENADKNTESHQTRRHALDAQKREVSSLQKVSASYQQYAAALKKGDTPTMIRSIESAERAAAQAVSEARRVAMLNAKRAELRQKAFDAAVQSLQAKGTRWQDALASWSNQVKQSGLPADFVKQLQSHGLPQKEIDKLAERAASLDVAQATAAIEARQQRLTVLGAMREKLKAAKIDYPPPPELDKLLEIQHRAHDLLQRLKNPTATTTRPAH